MSYSVVLWISLYMLNFTVTLYISSWISLSLIRDSAWINQVFFLGLFCACFAVFYWLRNNGWVLCCFAQYCGKLFDKNPCLWNVEGKLWCVSHTSNPLFFRWSINSFILNWKELCNANGKHVLEVICEQIQSLRVSTNLSLLCEVVSRVFDL